MLRRRYNQLQPQNQSSANHVIGGRYPTELTTVPLQEKKMETNLLTLDAPRNPSGSGYFRIAFTAIACLLGLLCLAEGMFYVSYTLGLIRSGTATPTEYIATTACLCSGLMFIYAGVLAFKHNFRAGIAFFALPFVAVLLLRIAV